MRTESFTASSVSARYLVDGLAERIEQVLQGLIPRGAKVALLDFPNHSNPGDSAIWLGEVRFLQNRSNRVVYTCDAGSSVEEIASRLSDDVDILLIHGGGNLGDIWQVHQEFREAVMQIFSEHRIVQFPQSIYFRKEDGLKKFQEVALKCRQYTLLVRDETSLQTARSLGINAILCPDMAFYLRSLPRQRLPEQDVLYLLRTDREAGLSMPSWVDAIDWVIEPATLRFRALQALWRVFNNYPRRLQHYRKRWLFHIQNAMAQERVYQGCRQLCRGKVVVTDRLHAHIFCMLMDIPHVILDNCYGKIDGFYQSWTINSSITRRAQTLEQAREHAEDLLRLYGRR